MSHLWDYELPEQRKSWKSFPLAFPRTACGSAAKIVDLDYIVNNAYYLTTQLDFKQSRQINYSKASLKSRTIWVMLFDIWKYVLTTFKTSQMHWASILQKGNRPRAKP